MNSVGAPESSRQLIDECASDPARLRLVAALREHALVLGEVTLASGATASYYVDARRAILLPNVFMDAGRLIARIAAGLRATAVGGVPVSAIPVACAALAGAASAEVQTTLKQAFIVRKERKAHGLQRLIEGPELAAGERCLIVEDVVTSGRSTVEVLERIAEQGLAVAGVICLLDRLAGGAEAIAAACDAPFIALTTIDEVYPERPAA